MVAAVGGGVNENPRHISRSFGVRWQRHRFWAAKGHHQPPKAVALPPHSKVLRTKRAPDRYLSQRLTESLESRSTVSRPRPQLMVSISPSPARIVSSPASPFRMS